MLLQACVIYKIIVLIACVAFIQLVPLFFTAVPLNWGTELIMELSCFWFGLVSEVHHVSLERRFLIYEHIRLGKLGAFVKTLELYIENPA